MYQLTGTRVTLAALGGGGGDQGNEDHELGSEFAALDREYPS